GTLVGGLARRGQETANAQHADAADGEKDDHADDQQALPRFFADGDAPLGAEEPDAVSEMPGGGEESDEIEAELPGDGELALDFAERRSGMRVEIDAGEAQVPHVPSDVGEGDEAGPALERVHPVALPGVGDGGSITAIPD